MRQQVASNKFDLSALKPHIESARRDRRGGKYEPALKYLEGNWAIIIEYKGPNQATYMKLTGVLYVLKDTEVTFREVGSTPEQKHTFSTNSGSNDVAGQISANLAFGNNTHTVKAIVFELHPKATFSDNFTGRSKKDLGVNEHVSLGFASVPAGITAAQAGKLLWTVDGTQPEPSLERQFLGLLQQSARCASGSCGATAAAPQADGTAHFIAPWATNMGSPLGGLRQRSRETTLRLVIQGGPSQGRYVERKFTVHTPVAHIVAGKPYMHVAGLPSAGFTGHIYFEPMNVSFHFIQFREGRGTMNARQTGWKPSQQDKYGAPQRPIPPSPSGYFAVHHDLVHQHSKQWLKISSGDVTNGCKMMGSDNVFSGANNFWPAKDNGKETDVPSEVSWRIFWQYKAEDLSGEGLIFQQAEHKATMDAKGTVTIEKAGATHSEIL